MLPLVVDALRNEVLKRLLEDATKGKTPVDHRISEDVLGELDTFHNKVCPMCPHRDFRVSSFLATSNASLAPLVVQCLR